MSKKQIFILVAFALLILGGLSLTLYLTKKPQDSRGNAQVLTCGSVPAVSGVNVEYPGCINNQCNFTKGRCSWNSLPEASSYNVTISVVETGNVIVNNQSFPSSTTQMLFDVGQTSTYKCSVTAINSCGSQSTPSADQLLCVTNGLLNPTATNTPTPTPTGTRTPTPTPTRTIITTTPGVTTIVSPTIFTSITIIIPTSTTKPPIAKPGGIESTLTITGFSIAAIIGGILLLAL